MGKKKVIGCGLPAARYRLQHQRGERYKRRGEGLLMVCCTRMKKSGYGTEKQHIAFGKSAVFHNLHRLP